MLGLKTSDIKNIAFFFFPSALDCSLVGSEFICIIWSQNVASGLEHWKHLAIFFFGLCTRKPQENSRTSELAGCQQKLSEICNMQKSILKISKLFTIMKTSL